MESSPLIKAHDHARTASTATHTADTTVAINEHTRAAGEFANAAKNTNSVEALRTLKLLEQHHQRLSELLQLPFKRPAQNANENDNDNDNLNDNANDNANANANANDDNHNKLQLQEKENSANATATSSTPSAKSVPSNVNSLEKNPQPMPKLAKQPRYPSRDLGASIASNLASARGIRSKYRGQPLSPSVSNTEAPGNVEAGSRKSGSRSKMQNMLDYSSEKPSQDSASPEKLSSQGSATSQDSAPASPPAPSGDEGFSKFYSAFGTIINRISAPLAFAGLPLINEEQADEPAHTPAPAPAPEPSTQKRIRLRPSPSVTAEPDISKIYSKATLRAIARDGQSGTDSFYVVPTSGHTASYASILSYADKEKRRNQAFAHADRGGGKAAASARGADDDGADEDDFVDARESQAPPHSPGLRRRGGAGASHKIGGAGRNTELAHVVEELYLENKSLKDALDKLSKRLHAFESMSQNSGMRLAESMRLMRPGSPVSTTSTSAAAAARAAGAGAGAGGDDAALLKKNRELEEQLLLVSKQMGDMEKNYNKACASLARYRDRWEQLKAGAKARRSTQGTSETADEGLGLGLRSPSLG